MWYTIDTPRDIANFMDTVDNFHDSCIKEMHYVSGAYENNDLSMHPVNDSRILRVVLQRQFSDNSMIEMEFSGLKRLQLIACDDTYTCEILDATLLWTTDGIYWCDCGGVSETQLEEYDGTVIGASSLRWRAVDGGMGQNEFYTSGV